MLKLAGFVLILKLVVSSLDLSFKRADGLKRDVDVLKGKLKGSYRSPYPLIKNQHVVVVMLLIRGFISSIRITSKRIILGYS